MEDITKDITTTSKSFTTNTVLEERFEMFKDVKERNVATLDQDAWKRSLNKLIGDGNMSEVSSKVEKVWENKNIDEKNV